MFVGLGFGNEAVMVAIDAVELTGTVLGHREELGARDLAIVIGVGSGKGGVAALALPALALGAGLGRGLRGAAATTLAFSALAFAGARRRHLQPLAQRLDGERRTAEQHSPHQYGTEQAGGSLLTRIENGHASSPQ